MVLPSNEFAQVNFQFTMAGNPNLEEITLGLNIGNSTDSYQDIVENLRDHWDQWPAHQQSSSLSFTQAVLKVGPDISGPTYVTPGSGGLYASSSSVPPNVAVLVRKVTALGGRRGRGRMYVPGIPEGSVSAGGLIGSSVIGDWQSALDSFLSALVADNTPPVLLHSDATAPTEITDFAVQAFVATQRRRLRH